MFKRIFLGLTFLAAFGMLSVAIPNEADAWGRWRRPYVTYYSAPPVYYDSYYYGPRYYRPYYGPRFYRPYRAFYGPRYYYYRPGVSISVGF